MPALYTHTSRPDGLALTAEIYNTDHQNHIDNLVPALIDDYSLNLSQMQSTADPGESGSESLATALSGELERLRFIVKEMKGTAQWYTTNIDRTIVLEPLFSQALDNLPDGLSNLALSHWRVPDNYATGDLTFTLLRRSSSASGTSVMRLLVSRRRSGSPSTDLVAGANIDFTPGTTNSVQTTHTNIQIGPGFLPGDFLLFQIQRLGTDSGDTNTGAVFIDGEAITYTSIAGRA